MHGIFAYIYPKSQPHVGKYTIHGSYGYKMSLSTYPTSPVCVLRFQGGSGEIATVITSVKHQQNKVEESIMLSTLLYIDPFLEPCIAMYSNSSCRKSAEFLGNFPNAREVSMTQMNPRWFGDSVI